jgi:hypothetical protein
MQPDNNSSYKCIQFACFIIVIVLINNYFLEAVLEMLQNALKVMAERQLDSEREVLEK